MDIKFKLIEILGEERIFKAYDAAGSRRISFGALVRFIKRNMIVKDLTRSLSVDEISKKHRVSRMTIYNVLKKSIK